MGKILNLLGKFLAVILSIPFIPLATASIILLSLSLVLFTPATYKFVLAKQKIYEKLPAIVADQFETQRNYTPKDVSEETESGAPPFLKNIDQAGWELILTDLLPANILKSQVEEALNQFLGAINFGNPNVKISLSKLKEHILNGGGTRAYLDLVRSQPPCTQSQLAQWGENLTELPTCSPPEEILVQFTPKIQEELTKVLANLGNEVDLSQSMGENLAIATKVRWGTTAAPIVPVLILSLITLLGARTNRGRMVWAGILLIISGLIGIGLAVSATPAFDWAWATYGASNVPAYYSPTLVDAGIALAKTLTITAAAATGVVFGLTILLGGFLIAKAVRR